MRKPISSPIRDQKRYAQLWAELESPKTLDQEERKE
jgi:hypothetical protein